MAQSPNRWPAPKFSAARISQERSAGHNRVLWALRPQTLSNSLSNFGQCRQSARTKCMTKWPEADVLRPTLISHERGRKPALRGIDRTCAVAALFLIVLVGLNGNLLCAADEQPFGLERR